MTLLGKTQEKHPGDLQPTVPDLPSPSPINSGSIGQRKKYRCTTAEQIHANKHLSNAIQVKQQTVSHLGEQHSDWNALRESCPVYERVPECVPQSGSQGPLPQRTANKQTSV